MNAVRPEDGGASAIAKVACRLVVARADSRAIDKATVAEIKSSISRLGLLSPIVVRRQRVWAQAEWVDGYELIAGRHRLRAAQELEWESIDAVVTDYEDVQAELAMISENLHRSDLTALQRDEQIARWVKLTGDRISAQPAPKLERGRPKAGINAAARELGIERTDAQRAVKVASLSQEAKAAAAEVGLDDNRTALLAASKEPDADRQTKVIIEWEAEPLAKTAIPSRPSSNDCDKQRPEDLSAREEGIQAADDMLVGTYFATAEAWLRIMTRGPHQDPAVLAAVAGFEREHIGFAGIMLMVQEAAYGRLTDLYSCEAAKLRYDHCQEPRAMSWMRHGEEVASLNASLAAANKPSAQTRMARTIEPRIQPAPIR